MTLSNISLTVVLLLAALLTKAATRQEMWLWLLTYDEAKLSDAYENKHLNALITRYLQNQLFSKNSEFYYRYRRVSESRQTQVPIETIYKDEEEENDD